MSSERFYTVAKVCELTGFHRATIWRMRRDGSMPAPIPGTRNNRVRWFPHEIDQWIARGCPDTSKTTLKPA